MRPIAPPAVVYWCWKSGVASPGVAPLEAVSVSRRPYAVAGSYQPTISPPVLTPVALNSCHGSVVPAL